MNTADELERVQAEYDQHVWAMRHHTEVARKLLPVVKHLQDCVAQEQLAELRKARRHLGPTVIRSASVG